MIEKIKARNGSTVFKVEGRLTASQVDPIREAQNWLAKLSSAISGRARVVIMGLGSGHHAVEMKKAFPGVGVVVVEPNGDLLQKVCLEYPLEMGEIDVVCIKKSIDLFRSPVILDALIQPFAVVEHRPSTILSSEFFSEVHELLVGRSVSALAQHLECRLGLKEIMKRLPEPAGEEQALSIKDLDAVLVNPEQGVSGEYMKLKLLRELIK